MSQTRGLEIVTPRAYAGAAGWLLGRRQHVLSAVARCMLQQMGRVEFRIRRESGEHVLVRCGAQYLRPDVVLLGLLLPLLNPVLLFFAVIFTYRVLLRPAAVATDKVAAQSTAASLPYCSVWNRST